LTRETEVWFKFAKLVFQIFDRAAYNACSSAQQGGKRMTRSANYTIGSITAVLLAVWATACTSVQEQPKPAAPAVAEKPARAEPQEAKKEEPRKQESTKAETKAASKKAVEVEGVISSVGQRTITFQVERKGKVREEVVGVDDKTNIEKGGNKVKLRDLQETDKALINYEPDAYTPANSVKVVGKGEIQKVGGDD
jgi:hypothetical protein